jgi:monoamine oxidase
MNLKFSRRTVLLAGLAAAGCGAKAKGMRVIVVGAGVSGLAAAQHLREAGAEVKVLEARDRIGGRIWTDRGSGSAVDLGASWLHGPDGNPLRRMVEKLGMKRAVTRYDRFGAWDASASPAKRLSDGEVRRLEGVLAKVMEELPERGSLADALCRAADELRLSPQDRRLLSLAVSMEVGNEFGEAPDRLDARFFGEAAEPQGDDWLFLDGYDALPHHLAEGLDISLSTAVTRVSADGGRVRVETPRGPQTADAAIISVPLALLKERALTIDPWPARCQEAVERLGVGVLSKTFLEFPREFWPDDLHAFGRMTEGLHPWSSFIPIPGKPLLLGLNFGAMARELEAQSPDDQAAEMTEALRSIFGSAVPEPVRPHVSAWSLDPWALGSYSLLAPGASAADYRALSQPLAPNLALAGEHTTAEHPSTVHGAYISGLRAAGQLLESRPSP